LSRDARRKVAGQRIVGDRARGLAEPHRCSTRECCAWRAGDSTYLHGQGDFPGEGWVCASALWSVKT
jgi:hypothetical protein